MNKLECHCGSRLCESSWYNHIRYNRNHFAFINAHLDFYNVEYNGQHYIVEYDGQHYIVDNKKYVDEYYAINRVLFLELKHKLI